MCIFFGTNWPHVPWPKRAAELAPQDLHIPANHIDTPRTRQARARYGRRGRRGSGKYRWQIVSRVLLGQKAKHRDKIFTTHSGDGKMNVYPTRSLRTAGWKYILNLRPEFRNSTHVDIGKAADSGSYSASWVRKAATDPAAAAVVNRYHQHPAEELYDLAADPHEMKNLADDPQQSARRGEMRSEVGAWMRANHDEGKIYGPPRLLSDPKRAEVR